MKLLRSPQALSPLRRRLRVILLAVASILFLLCVALAVSSWARVITIRTGLQIIGVDTGTDASGFTNLLLLGTGDEGHDGADLTDTMILVSLDPAGTKSAVLLSLPRDLYVETASGTVVYGRINTMYYLEKSRLEHEGSNADAASLAALASVGQAIGGKLGVQVHGVLKADFSAFTNTVDTLGGVMVDVPEPITDYNYPLTETRMGTFTIGSGMQLLDGETALKYARSRHSTNDFDRSARQQLILGAMADAVRSFSRFEQVTFFLQLYKQLQGHWETTLPSGQLAGLAQIAQDIPLSRVLTYQLNFDIGADGWEAAAGGFVTDPDPAVFSGASILVPAYPAAGITDWSRIRMFTQLLLTQRSVFLDPPSVHIQSVPATSLSAWRLRNELLRFGFTVLPLQALTKEQAASVSGSLLTYKNGRFKESASLMGALSGLPVERTSDVGTGSGDVLILLNSDYRFVPFGAR